MGKAVISLIKYFNIFLFIFASHSHRHFGITIRTCSCTFFSLLIFSFHSKYLFFLNPLFRNGYNAVDEVFFSSASLFFCTVPSSFFILHCYFYHHNSLLFLIFLYSNLFFGWHRLSLDELFVTSSPLK